MIEEEFDSKVLELQAAYNKKKQPIYTRRAEAVAKIPNFWGQACSKHRILNMFMLEEDAELFKHVKSLIVEEADDIKSGYKITVHFAPNPIIEDAELWKNFEFTDDGQAKVTQSGVRWKSKAEDSAKGAKRLREESQGFFYFFHQEGADDVDVGNAIKDELWPNPIKYYTGEIEEEEGESDEEEEDEEEEEN